MNLREWMHQEGLSQAQAAGRLGVSQQDISRWLAGQNLPTLQKAKLCWERSNKAITMESWDSLSPTNEAIPRSRPTEAR